MADFRLDCKATPCPLPIVKISQIMKEMNPGQTVEIETTDPGFPNDIHAWIRRTGHQLVSLEEGPITRTMIKKVKMP